MHIEIIELMQCKLNYSVNDPVFNQEFGNKSFNGILEPLADLKYNLKSEDIYNVDIELETSNPTAGFISQN